MKRRFLSGFLRIGLVCVLAACSGPDERAVPGKPLTGPLTGPLNEPLTGPLIGAAVKVEPIAPRDFVVAPCDRLAGNADCLIIAAGGKRVLIGAPAGIGAGHIAGDPIAPDAVILFSLHGAAIEGLDEVRNRAWVSARRTPLVVAGGEGIARIVTGLNEAYITSDALAYIEGARKGGFDSDAIIAKTVAAGDIAFDTGDLTITALPGGAGKLALWVDYEGRTLLLAGCGAEPNEIAIWPLADIYIGCRQEGYAAPVAGDWPLVERVYIKTG